VPVPVPAPGVVFTAGATVTFVPEKIVLPPLYFGSDVNAGFIARISFVVSPLAAAISLRVSPRFTVTFTAGDEDA
jgi:hypothetical protein